jgi:hypothetical protein
VEGRGPLASCTRASFTGCLSVWDMLESLRAWMGVKGRRGERAG